MKSLTSRVFTQYSKKLQKIIQSESLKEEARDHFLRTQENFVKGNKQFYWDRETNRMVSEDLKAKGPDGASAANTIISSHSDLKYLWMGIPLIIVGGVLVKTSFIKQRSRTQEDQIYRLTNQQEVLTKQHAAQMSEQGQKEPTKLYITKKQF